MRRSEMFPTSVFCAVEVVAGPLPLCGVRHFVSAFASDHCATVAPLTELSDDHDGDRQGLAPRAAAGPEWLQTPMSHSPRQRDFKRSAWLVTLGDQSPQVSS